MNEGETKENLTDSLLFLLSSSTIRIGSHDDGVTLTSSPRLKPGDSSRHREGFLLRGGVPGWAFTLPGLNASPQAATASPAANTFFAALISRSWDM